MKTILFGLPLLFSFACTDDLAVAPSSAANASASEAPPATTSVVSLASNFNPDTVAPAPTAASTSTAAATGHEHHAAGPSAKHAAPKQTQPAQYTCPHHPEVISDKPGECPKCHMDLVPKQPDAKGGHEGHDHGAHQ
ncbi:MAG: hypothetical protein HOV80_28685 [Polyangiaceae bacterium]|nr:hypothetical protein [Polyangiaceae bacterium]